MDPVSQAPENVAGIRERLKELGLQPYDCVDPKLMDYIATWTAKSGGVVPS